jgi:hypothetical protein
VSKEFELRMRIQFLRLRQADARDACDFQEYRMYGYAIELVELELKEVLDDPQATAGS